jgi:magnesium chelatase family protein
MLAKVMSCAVVGLEGAIVEVEADISPGLPSFTLVGTQYQLQLQV